MLTRLFISNGTPLSVPNLVCEEPIYPIKESLALARGHRAGYNQIEIYVSEETFNFWQRQLKQKSCFKVL